MPSSQQILLNLFPRLFCVSTNKAANFRFQVVKPDSRQPESEGTTLLQRTQEEPHLYLQIPLCPSPACTMAQSQELWVLSVGFCLGLAEPNRTGAWAWVFKPLSLSLKSTPSLSCPLPDSLPLHTHSDIWRHRPYLGTHG